MNATIKELEAKLKKAKTLLSKMEVLIELSEAYFYSNPTKSRELAEQCIKEAEFGEVTVDSKNASNIVTEINAITEKKAIAFRRKSVAETVIGKHTEALDSAKEGLFLSKKCNNLDIIGRAYASLASAYYKMNDYENSIFSCKEGLNCYESSENSLTTAILLAILGSIYSNYGNYQESINYFDKSINILLSDEQKHQEELDRVYIDSGGSFIRIGNYEEAIERFKKGIALSKKFNHTANLANGTVWLSMAYIGTGQYTKAIEYLEISEKLYVQINTVYGLALVKEKYGTIYSHLGEFEKSLDYYYDCLNLQQQIQNNLSISVIYNNIGTVLTAIRDKTAISYFTKSYEMSYDIGYKRGMAIAKSNLSGAYFTEGNIDKALTCCQESLKISQEIGDKISEMGGLIQLGHCFSKFERYSEAEELFLKSISIAKETESKFQFTRATMSLGDLYRSQLLFEKSIKYLFEALETAKEIGDKEAQYGANGFLFQTYQEKGDFEKALYHHKEYHRIEKEVFNEESDKRLKNLQVIHDVEKTKKQSEILTLENEKMKIEQELQTKHLTTLTMSLVQQNEFLHTLRNELLHLSDTVGSQLQSPLKDIARRVKKQSQAQEEWSAFEEQFNIIHTDFIKRLSEKYPILSPTELKVCALLRMGLSSKEISTLLFNTLRCIETHRYRIRKKIGASPKDNLILILNSI